MKRLRPLMDALKYRPWWMMTSLSRIPLISSPIWIIAIRRNLYIPMTLLPGSTRAWERVADTFVDPILVDISYWKWAERPDNMPDGLLEAARADLRLIYDALNKELAERQFVSGPLSIADIALFPHVASVRAMEVEFSMQEHPNVGRWFKEMRGLPICAADLKRA